MKNPDLLPLWQRLKQMLQKYEPFMRVTIDEHGYYRLYTLTRRPFIAVAIQKKHVGIYSMSLYDSSHLDGVLGERRIGKSCIGFRTDDDPLLVEVPAYFERCFQHCVTNEQVPMH